MKIFVQMNNFCAKVAPKKAAEPAMEITGFFVSLFRLNWVKYHIFHGIPKSSKASIC
ncbi:hypothetical protein THIARS_70595 [Thiomonas delicata]|uniref:Uncharacterized protein n=1 Tax=Thiomonas delicata TaxID=364030 RepID=A0A238D6V2_THIDL|nr:hypothetical protein THIARS_70595 [Thiomonas delicata]